jgi:hypothetical protein
MKINLPSHWASLSAVVLWFVSLLLVAGKRMNRPSIGQQKGIPEWAVTVREKDHRSKQDSSETKSLFFLFIGLAFLLWIGEKSIFSGSIWFLVVQILAILLLGLVCALSRHD